MKILTREGLLQPLREWDSDQKKVIIIILKKKFWTKAKKENNDQICRLMTYFITIGMPFLDLYTY